MGNIVHVGKSSLKVQRVFSPSILMSELVTLANIDQWYDCDSNPKNAWKIWLA